MNRAFKTNFIFSTLFLFISACGSGGGGGGSNTIVPTPVADTSPPVITIQGESNLELPYGTAYTDDGATAEDDVDGSVSVTAEGTVDTFSAGTYTVTYSASDAAGNSSTITRTVTVLPRQFQLDVSVFGDGALTINGASATGCTNAGDYCVASFDEATSVDIDIAPNVGWSFEDWQSCDSVSANTCTVIMDSDKLVLATLSNNTPLTLKPNVILLTEDEVDGIINYNPSSNSVLFSASIDTSSFGIGDVIVSTGSSTNEVYFARRIVDILGLAGATTIIETVDASLEDVIEEGTLIASPEITGTTVLKSSLPEGISVAKSDPNNPDKVTLTLASVTLFNQSGLTVTGNGTIDLDFQPDINLDFTTADGLRSFRFSGDANVTGSVRVSITGTTTGALAGTRDFPLGTVKLATVVVGPAVFVVQADFSVPVEIGASASATPRISLTQVATLGVQWHKNSDWTNLSRYAISSDFEFAETVTANLKAQVGGRMRPAVRLYGVAGPFIESDVYAGMNIRVTPAANCTFVRRDYVGASILAGGDLNLLSKRLVVKTKPIKEERTRSFSQGECQQDTEPPSNVEGLSAEAVGAMELNLSWLAATDNYGVVAYQVWRRDSNFGRPRLVATTAGTSYLDRGLEPETEYCYYVLALDEANNSSMIPSSLTCATTLEPLDEEPPTIPSSLSAEAVSTSSIELDWGASTDNEEVVGYVLLDYTRGSSSAYEVGSVSSTSTIISNLNPETEYCFAVRAYDRRGNQSEPSNVSCATTPPAEAAEWTFFLGCQGLPFLLEKRLDLDETLNSVVQVTGAGVDYPGTPFTYVLSGIYNADTAALSADLTSVFPEGIRVDRFNANLGSGDSGIVLMTKLTTGGCPGQIRFLRNETTSEKPQIQSEFGIEESEISLFDVNR